jgi:hypothetical protein
MDPDSVVPHASSLRASSAAITSADAPTLQFMTLDRPHGSGSGSGGGSDEKGRWCCGDYCGACVGSPESALEQRLPFKSILCARAETRCLGESLLTVIAQQRSLMLTTEAETLAEAELVHRSMQSWFGKLEHAWKSTALIDSSTATTTLYESKRAAAGATHFCVCVCAVAVALCSNRLTPSLPLGAQTRRPEARSSH